MMIELERTFLAKRLPEGLEDCKSKETLDVYIPKDSVHPCLRIRKQGDRCEITKKEPVKEGDASQQVETTISLTPAEFESFDKLEGKRLRKIRHYLPCAGRTAEVDVFQDKLKGLVVIDFELEDIEEMKAFKMPDFCLADITQEVFTAGGMLCGKSYDEIKKHLDKHHYKKL
jgi:CYTH domain-containing protein